MTMQENMAINFDAQVVFEARGSRWAAYIEPPGMTVYGVTEEAVKARVDLALKLFVQHFNDSPDGVGKLRQYLDSHGVPNFVTHHDVNSPIRRRRPVSLSMEVAVNA